MEWIGQTRRRFSRFFADRFSPAAAGQVSDPQIIFQMMRRGTPDVRNTVLNRISGDDQMLLQVVRLAEDRLRKNPVQADPRTWWGRRRDRERVQLRELAGSLISHTTNRDILYALAKSPEVREAAAKTLMDLNDPVFLTRHVSELIANRAQDRGSSQRRATGDLRRMALDEEWRTRLPVEALDLIYGYFASQHGRDYTVEVLHPYIPGTPGHGGTRAYTSYDTYKHDHRLEMEAVRGELLRRPGRFLDALRLN